MSELAIRLRPVAEPDLEMFARFATEPGLVGLDWGGFRDAQEPVRRFASDGFLRPEDGRLIVEVAEVAGAVEGAGAMEAAGVAGGPAAAGFVSYRAGIYGSAGQFFEIGIALLPEWRGRGIGWRAQAMLCDYLFSHAPVQRIQAGTHPENIAEQRALVKAGFTLEGVIRASEFRAGAWRDGYLYSRLRDDPAPEVEGVSGA